MSAPGPVYEPPRQSRSGQLVDAVTILVLIFATLFVTTWLTSEDSASDAPAAVRPVAELPLSPGERTQYQKVIDSGTADAAAVSAAVEANQPRGDKYPIDLLALLGTAALLTLYLGFVYRTSLREYREVVEEKFGPRPGPPPGAHAEHAEGDR